MDDCRWIDVSIRNRDKVFNGAFTALEEPGVCVRTYLSSNDIGLWVAQVANLRCQNFNIKAGWLGASISNCVHRAICKLDVCIYNRDPV